MWPDPSFERVVLVVPHPDDEVFMVGFARQAQRLGAVVSVVCVSRGEKGRLWGRRASPQEVAAQRTAELAKSCLRIGAENPIHLGIADAGAEADDDAQVNSLSAALDTIRPDAIVSYGFDGGYGHRDHVMVARLVDKVRRRALPVAEWFQLRFPRGLFSRFINNLGRHAPELFLAKELERPPPDGELVELFLSAEAVALKRAVIKEHGSQLRADGCFLFPELEAEILRRELYVRVIGR